MVPAAVPNDEVGPVEPNRVDRGTNLEPPDEKPNCSEKEE
jgi:hypothetical protein